VPRRTPLPTNRARTCKTVSGRMRQTIYLKQKIIIFVKILPDKEFIFLPLATLKIQEATVTILFPVFEKVKVELRFFFFIIPSNWN
jgi:hypothetical protein